MATAGDVTQLARDTMRGFDTRFLRTDQELWRRLLRLEKRTIRKLVRLDNMALSLPGDAQATIGLTPYQASYDLPLDFWAHRQMTAVYATGPDLPVRVVPSNHRGMVPATTPSLYLVGLGVFPMDGGAIPRRFGWAGASQLVVDYVTEPTLHTSSSSQLHAPDEAVEYLAHELALYMATRAKSAEAVLEEIRGRRAEVWEDLVAEAKSLPGADSFTEEA